jgi:septal ring factor EnvC (AmiA/AmiB activator)
MNLEPDDLRREIDEALAEIDALEDDVLALFDELLGERAAERVAEYIAAQQRQSRLAPFMKAVSPAPSEEPPTTR